MVVLVVRRLYLAMTVVRKLSDELLVRKVPEVASKYVRDFNHFLSNLAVELCQIRSKMEVDRSKMEVDFQRGARQCQIINIPLEARACDIMNVALRSS